MVGSRTTRLVKEFRQGSSQIMTTVMTDQTLDGVLLMAMLDAMPDAVLVTNAKGIITRANKATAALFGFTQADLAGQSIHMLMPTATAAPHDGFSHCGLSSGALHGHEEGRIVDGMRRDGHVFPLHLSVGHARHMDETHFVVIMHDISRRVAAEEALARAARLDAIGQMTGGISHDFNNILTVVIGNLELLEGRIKDTESQEIVADALQAAALGAELTAGLGALGGKTTPHSHPIDVNMACHSALTMIKRTFDPHFEIQEDLTDALPAVLGDATQLQSALINIALNARDAMPDGGKLIIRSDAIVVGDDYIAQQLHVGRGAYVRVCVTDTGHGIGAETLPQVFEPFFTTKPAGQGTGLGLAMVDGFMRQCGGHVAVYSKVGLGTTVALYFPTVAMAAPQKPAVRQTAARKSACHKTVLVVEDDPQLRKLTGVRLKALGFDIREAARGDVAADILQQEANKIDAVFTDMVMPGALDGLGLARLVGASYPDTRILLTSGYAEGTLGRCNTDSGYQILRKPYRQSDLAQAFAVLFDAR